MEITKQEMANWLVSENAQIASLAMKNQWMAILEENPSLFSEDELWQKNPSQSASGLCLAVKKNETLVYPMIRLLEGRLIAGKQLPFCVWVELMSLSSYHLDKIEDKILIRNFVSSQKFEGQELYEIIGSALRCIDRMPEWHDCAERWISQVSPDVNFCIIVQRFLTEWGRLAECSNDLIVSAFDKLLPEWAPLMIGALNNVPGPYRYAMSFDVFKKYFNQQSEEVIKAIVKCFDEDRDVDLQQKLLDNIFNFFNSEDCEIYLSSALIFVEGIKNFLLHHWGNNCFKFSLFWEKFHYAPEFFDIIRAALKNDLNFVMFDKGSNDKLAKLKTPLHMLCYMPVVERIDLCLLLLKAVSRGDSESHNLAARILVEKEDFLQFDKALDFKTYYKQLEEIVRDSCPISYEIRLFASAILNAMVKSGAKIEDFALLYDFIKMRDLSVPALYELYPKEIDDLLYKRRYESEILDYLLKN